MEKGDHQHQQQALPLASSSWERRGESDDTVGIFNWHSGLRLSPLHFHHQPLLAEIQSTSLELRSAGIVDSTSTQYRLRTMAQVQWGK
jgi:hypothetical protein